MCRVVTSSVPVSRHQYESDSWRVDDLRDAGSTVDDLPTGHFPMRSLPTALTALLLQSAVAVPSDSSVGDSA